MTLNEGFELFRSDLNEPPKQWVEDFISYQYAGIGSKNPAGLFFFTDSRDIAVDIATEGNKSKGQDHYFLTRTEISCETVELIDLSECPMIFTALIVLQQSGIEVANNRFKTYFEIEPPHNETLENLGHLLGAFRSKVVGIKMQDVTLDQLHCTQVSEFLQRLSDFDNGFELKAQIKTLDSNVMGYCWRERNDYRGLTYCFIDPHCLAHPNSQRVLFVE